MDTKFCRKCGKQLIAKMKVIGYDINTGDEVIVWEVTCPDYYKGNFLEKPFSNDHTKTKFYLGDDGLWYES